MNNPRILYLTASRGKRFVQRSGLVNFTTLDTVYARPIKTVSLKVRRINMNDKEFNLLTIGNDTDAYEILRAIFAQLDADQEHVVMLVLNMSGNVTGFKVIASGALTHASFDPKVLYRNALLLGAARIIVAHNHPSDDPQPSPADLEATDLLVTLGESLALPLVDHFILLSNSFLSIRKLHPNRFH